MNCPFLGLREDPSTSLSYPSIWNYCNLAKPPDAPDADHQKTICLGEAYKTCPVLLRQQEGPLPPEIRDPGPRLARTGIVNWWAIVAAGLLLLLLVVIGWQVFGHGSIPAAAGERTATPGETSTAQPSATLPTPTSTASQTVSSASTFPSTTATTSTPTATPTITKRYLPPATATFTPTVQLAPCTLPSITGGPLPNTATRTVGDQFFFSVTATGSAPLFYQWKNGTSDVGTNSNAYTIDSVVVSDAGSYTVEVSNSCGSRTSNAASLTVNKATPSVTTWPTASGITYGNALSFSSLSGGNATVPGSFTFDQPGMKPSAGSYDAAVTFTPSDTENYNTVSGTVSVYVAKADPTCNIIGWTGTWNGESHGASGDCTGVDGAILSGLDPGASFSDVPGGIANWTFTPSDANYNGASGSVPIVIN